MTREEYYKMPLEWDNIKEPQSKILIDKIFADFESREKELQDIIDRQRKIIDNMVIS